MNPQIPPHLEALAELVAVVARLRDPEGGCPWDLAQTHASLVPYVLEEAHEVAANALMATVGVHVAGVLFSGWLHHENLVRAMLTGRKRATADQAIPAAWAGLGVVMVVAALWFWWSQR